MRRRMAAMAAGLVLLMTTGCAAEAEPQGDALYAAGEERYTAFATGLHDVLMTVHDQTWDVKQNDYGAAPISCPGSGGYFFQALRRATPSDADATDLERRAREALEALDLEVTSSVLGSGDRQEYNVVGVGGVFERVVVAIQVASGSVLVTAKSTCAPGSAPELGDLVFADSTARDQWRLLPATEGPDSVPQFYFPPDGPVYYDEAGDPIQPQPVVTDPPVAPYGG
ncbi:MAG: hypothetical protein WBX17_04460 [Microbacterium sp.]